MTIETHFPLLTVVCNAKEMHHRVAGHLNARLAYTATVFNVCVSLWHDLHPGADPFTIRIDQFSLYPAPLAM